jgi:hypothetical protein
MTDVTIRKIALEDTQGFWNALSSVAIVLVLEKNCV